MSRYQNDVHKTEERVKSLNIKLSELKEYLKRIEYDGLKHNTIKVEDEDKFKIEFFYANDLIRRENPIYEFVFIIPDHLENNNELYYEPFRGGYRKIPHRFLTLEEIFKPKKPPFIPSYETENILIPSNEDYAKYFSFATSEQELQKFKNLSVNFIQKYIKEQDHMKDLLKEKSESLKEIESKCQSSLLSLQKRFNSGETEAIEEFIKLVFKRHPLPNFLEKRIDTELDLESQILIIEYEFPDYADIKIPKELNEKLFLDKELVVKKIHTEASKKKIIKKTLYSIMVRNLILASKYAPRDKVESIVLNVTQKWFDLATGQPRNGIIASVIAKIDDLNSLNIEKLDPEACIRNLKGIVTTSLEKINPVRPIMTLNKEDSRIVDSINVEDRYDEDQNIAAIPWQDFEHLIAQLFEWEFKSKGIEVKVTKASRDKGVDALLFDPDPLRGGKFAVQAKRYVNTVDVSAVRDLYGTVVNEGANRGILITTAHYGPDSYEFAKDKPISLVDGPNLLEMLRRHGKKYRIDLDEARELNKIKN